MILSARSAAGWLIRRGGLQYHMPTGLNRRDRGARSSIVLIIRWSTSPGMTPSLIANGRVPDCRPEAQWEMAARGGLKQTIYPWGDELTPAGEHRCNIWQGDFPEHNTADDGYAGKAPVPPSPVTT